ncbi:uncharacterized protein [Branchiostoma lanceolatum]|uniref:uncharacterized protein n=1 Tax=Branchiostoma lanceolatum TaxID=7740 RepID=UPI003452DB40
MDVQSVVEEPKVYLLARCKSTIADQLKYARCQREDIKTMQDTNYQDVKIRDVVRYFTGDNPAQWVESGEQHQGTYGCPTGCGAPRKRFMDLGYCLHLQVKSLEGRRQLITSLPAGARGGSAPFKGLNKDQLIQNLDATGYDFDLECNKPELESQLKQHLAGASHIPALLYDEQQSTLKAINLEQYEVSSFESLHNAKEHIKNLLEELPNHVNQLEVQSTFQGKEVMRGSDFRKLLITVTTHLAANGGDLKVVELPNTLCEVVHICYLGEDERSPRLVLRLANQIYMHSLLVREVIGTQPTSIKPRKLYGQYYHSISTHAPILYRLINLKSVNAKHQEKLFNSLRGILCDTTSRRPGEVLGIGLVRLQAEQQGESDMAKEESQVSALGKSLRSVVPSNNTVIPWRYLSKPGLQLHYQPRRKVT